MSLGTPARWESQWTGYRLHVEDGPPSPPKPEPVAHPLRSAPPPGLPFYALGSALERWVSLTVPFEVGRALYRLGAAPEPVLWQRTALTIADIQHATTLEFGCTVGDIKGLSRHKRIARPRQVAMYLARDLLARTWAEIGRAHGSRDHTTAMHGYRAILKAVEVDSEMAGRVAAVKQRLGVG